MAQATNSYTTLQPIQPISESVFANGNNVRESSLFVDDGACCSSDGIIFPTCNFQGGVTSPNWSANDSFDLLVNSALSDPLFGNSFGDFFGCVASPSFPSTSDTPMSYTILDCLSPIRPESQSCSSDNHVFVPPASDHICSIKAGIEDHKLILDFALAAQQFSQFFGTWLSASEATAARVSVVLRFPKGDVTLLIPVKALVRSTVNTTSEAESLITDFATDSSMNECVKLGITDDNIVRQADGSEQYTCLVCANTLFSSKRALELHLKAHIENYRPFKCQVCGQGFKQLSHWGTHMKVHSDEKKFQCDTCQLSFRLKHHLVRHQHSVHKMQPIRFSCERCSKAFAYENELKMHVQKSHAEFVCEHCQTVCTGETAFKDHMKQHEKLRVHTCTVCSKSCGTAFKLKRHMARHSTTRMHICSECGAEFKLRHHLKMHCHIHSKVPFTCDTCEATFSLLANLKRHQRVHRDTSSNQYGCPTCGKKFSRCDTLKQHMSTHLEPKFACDECGTKFARAIDLKNHQLAHRSTGLKAYACAVCGSRFSHARSLKKHQTNVGHIQ